MQIPMVDSGHTSKVGHLCLEQFIIPEQTQKSKTENQTGGAMNIRNNIHFLLLMLWIALRNSKSDFLEVGV
jgi:hypothetical protein